MKWIKATEKLPASGQEVLTYYYDEVSERDEIGILTYFKMGDVMYTKIDRNPKLSKAQRFMNTLYADKFQIKAEEDGFYIFEWGADGDTQARKHKDWITHWMELPKAPVKESDQMEYDLDDDNLCNDCEYEQQDGELVPCNSCINFVDGYLEAINYSNKHLNKDKGGDK